MVTSYSRDQKKEFNMSVGCVSIAVEPCNG